MFIHRNWMLMLPLLSSLVVGCDPGQAPATSGELSDSKVATVEQALSSSLSISLVSRPSGMCVDVAASNMGDGATVYQWTCHGGANQKYYLEPDGTGYYSIVAQHSGRCLAVAGGINHPGAAISQTACNGSDDQKFAFNDLGTGFYNIVAKKGWRVSMPDNHYGHGAVVALAVGTGVAAEFWLKL